MNESWNRWKARIGSLKPLAVLVLIVGLIGLFAAAGELVTAAKNPGEPEPVTIGQLIDGTVGPGQHVAVSGYATLYDAYTLKKDGRQKATYFYVLDRQAGHAVVVKASTATTYGRQSRQVAFSGMTRSTPGDLKKLIEDNIPEIKESGFKTAPDLYVHEEAKPPSLPGSLTWLLITATAALTSSAITLFPGTVFAPYPMEPGRAPDYQERPATKATGRFQRLKSVNPVQIGRGSRKFVNGVANIVPLAERSLMIYIHHTVRGRGRRSVTDWGAFFDGDNVMSIEPGKLYGWRDRPALRFQYRGPRDKPATLLLSFDDAEAQATAVAIIDKLGFTVGAG